LRFLRSNGDANEAAGSAAAVSELGWTPYPADGGLGGGAVAEAAADADEAGRDWRELGLVAKDISILGINWPLINGMLGCAP